MKTTSDKTLLFAFFVLLLAGCTVDISSQNKRTGSFVKGADIGWLPQMETSGYKFYNEKGVEEDCFKILKDHGINTIRLRTWVNPSDSRTSGHCSKDETGYTNYCR